MSAALVAYQKAYEFGRWNDLSITLALAESLTKQKTEKGEQLTLESMKPEMDAPFLIRGGDCRQ
jgi:hypothetical protein